MNNIKTSYVLDGSTILSETTGNETLNYYYDSIGVLQQIGYKKGTAAEVYYLVAHNGQGDVIAIYNASDSTPVGTYTYDAWGKILFAETASSTSDPNGILMKNPFRYRGYYYDRETGFYYLQSRYYNPGLGRFINADDVGVVTASLADLTDKNLFVYCDNNPVVRVDDGGHFWMLIGAVAGAVVGGIAGAAISYATTGSVNWWAVAGGAAAGALIGCGAGYLADKAVMASSWASAAAAGGTSSAAIGRNFEKWYYQYNNISKSIQQVAIKGIGRLDAITKGKIIELKNYDWSKYTYLSSVISRFTEQGQRYMQLIGQKVNGQTIKSVEFFFSSKPPQEVIRALQDIGVSVNWIN